MKTALRLFCLVLAGYALSSCEALWGAAYHFQGGWFARPKPSLPLAAWQLKRLTEDNK